MCVQTTHATHINNILNLQLKNGMMTIAAREHFIDLKDLVKKSYNAYKKVDSGALCKDHP